MRLSSIYQKIRRFRPLALIGGGGAVFGVVPGCDPEVANILVGGLEAASISVIQALFETVTQEAGIDASGTVPTVLLDAVTKMLA